MKRSVTPGNMVLLLASFLFTCRLDSQELRPVKPEVQNKDHYQTPPWEEIFLQTDRTKYIAGEDVWFSIYTFDMETARLSARSLIAYIELLNPWNIPVIQSRILLSGGRGDGSFSIPDSISSGTYTIRAYTNWMKNFLPENCFMEDIDIYNPFSDSGFRLKRGKLNSLKIDEKSEEQEMSNRITLTSDTVFGRRQKVSLKLTAGTDNKGLSGINDFSVSIAPGKFIEGSQDMERWMLTRQKKWKEIFSKTVIKPRYSFENNGHILSVTIKYREKAIDSSDFVYMSIRGKVAVFDYAERDSSGRYNFILPADSRLRNLILQPEDANNNMILEIEPSFSRVLPASDGFVAVNTDSLANLFEEMSFNYQASRIYGISSKMRTETDNMQNLKKRRFYGIPEMEIFLDDYIKLPSMQEVFYELLPGINLRQRKTEYEILIINPLTGVFYNEPPLVMIDGVIINDLNILADLNPELVEKIEVVKTPYLIGDLILHGIVNVLTRSGDFSDITMPEFAVMLPYRVTDPQPVFTSPDYSDENLRLGRIPDLRNTLYWNPSVKTNSKGEAEIEFWTSDIPGVYTISIQGVSSSGELVSLNRSFIVR